MEQERRRFFRINDTLGISYHLLENKNSKKESAKARTDVLDLVSEQDRQIEKLLLELEDESPKVAQLISVFNQKLERIVQQMVLESRLVGRIAHRVKEANISACGIAFENDEQIDVGAMLNLELTFYPSEKNLQTKAMVVGCDALENGYYWRIDFCGMDERKQEVLIQHMVKAQSHQLMKRRQE